MGPQTRELDPLFALKDRLADFRRLDPVAGFRTAADGRSPADHHLYKERSPDLLKERTADMYSVKERAMLQGSGSVSGKSRKIHIQKSYAMCFKILSNGFYKIFSMIKKM